METQEPLHGSAFNFKGAGCLILGASGTGKSRLLAEAMALGAKLVADDRLTLQLMLGMLAVAPVPQLMGIMELRGLGLVKINDFIAKQMIHVVIELDPAADSRLPEAEKRTYLGVEVPYLRLPPVPQTSAAALLIYLQAMQEGRALPTDWKPAAA